VTGRPRTSTLVLATAFLVTFVLYLVVRPEPERPTELVPAVRVTVTTTTTTTTAPKPPPSTTTTTAAVPTVPLTSSTSTSTTAAPTTSSDAVS